ncbi:glutaminyl-peptide cyclotransferase [Algiphilus sp.]|uniref:glutaminyl-peptide cyclotransferase n=1 Tax=Algiphilus sp. TaxID=1872431 RepID=UPI003BAD43FF
MQPKANLYAVFRPLMALVVTALTASCSSGHSDGRPLQGAPVLEWTLIATHAHDPERFTQGLQLRDGIWLESSGGYGESFVVLERAQRAHARLDLPANQFAEGATFVDDAIWLLTWRAGQARILDQDLQVQRVVRYAGEGWGLTYDGDTLIMSDGSNYLTRRDPDSFAALSGIAVRDGDRPVTRLNELEYAHGLVWANVFGTQRIAAIATHDGQVCAWLQLDSLAERIERPPGWDAANNVLNGIAVDHDTGHLHVTGKRWPKRFEIRIDELEATEHCAAH